MISPTDASKENYVENLNLSSGGSLQTITGDDLWRKHGPKTLTKAIDFIGRVVKLQAQGTSLKRAVQQTRIKYTKPTLFKDGIREYNFSHPELSDSEGMVPSLLCFEGVVIRTMHRPEDLNCVRWSLGPS